MNKGVRDGGCSNIYRVLDDLLEKSPEATATLFKNYPGFTDNKTVVDQLILDTVRNENAPWHRYLPNDLRTLTSVVVEKGFPQDQTPESEAICLAYKEKTYLKFSAWLNQLACNPQKPTQPENHLIPTFTAKYDKIAACDQQIFLDEFRAWLSLSPPEIINTITLTAASYKERVISVDEYFLALNCHGVIVPVKVHDAGENEERYDYAFVYRLHAAT